MKEKSGKEAFLTFLRKYGYIVGLGVMLVVISTIIDAPATLLNSVGNTCSSMMVARLVDGKNWYKR